MNIFVDGLHYLFFQNFKSQFGGFNTSNSKLVRQKIGENIGDYFIGFFVT